MEMYDIAIIGTGPAGLSAAITAKIRNKNILLLGNKELSNKVEKGHKIQNYLGLPDITGKELAAAYKKHIDMLSINITEDKINGIYSMGDYFAIQGRGTTYQAKTVIVSTGVNFGKPLKGEMEFLGSGVSYCANCDAFAYRGKEVAVIAYEPTAENEAEFLKEMTSKVYYLPLYKNMGELSQNIQVVKAAPVEIIGNERVNTLKTSNGAINVEGVFIIRESVLPSQLIGGLKMKENHIEVNMQMETNIEGLFACGDITGTPYQYIKAAGQGNVAALSAVKYLERIKKSQGLKARM